MVNRKNPVETGRIGGLIRGGEQHQEAIRRYNANPKTCEECGKAIPLNPRYPATWTRQRRFCNYNCSAAFNAKHRLKLRGIKPLAERTKGEVFQGAKSDEKRWWRARTHIGQHARRIYMKSGRPKACAICGYDKHVEIAHRRAIPDFPDSALISEINDIANLVPLCRNHHWEQEHGLLQL